MYAMVIIFLVLRHVLIIFESSSSGHQNAVDCRQTPHDSCGMESIISISICLYHIPFLNVISTPILIPNFESIAFVSSLKSIFSTHNKFMILFTHNNFGYNAHEHTIKMSTLYSNHISTAMCLEYVFRLHFLSFSI